MIQYDLTETPLARTNERAELPSEAELTVITVALALAHGCALGELAHRELVLRDETIESVTRILRNELASLLGDLHGNGNVGARLAELRGLRISAIGR